MAGFKNKKRSNDGSSQHASKKQKRKQQYHSDSEEETGDFDAVNLLDSDDDIHNAQVDDVGAADDDSEDSDSSMDEQAPAKKLKAAAAKSQPKQQPGQQQEADSHKDEEEDDEEEEEEEEEDDDDEDDDDEDGSDDGEGNEGNRKKSKSKRNDPSAFATSLNKILSTKLTTSKRADPVLSRSAAAHEASKAAVDSALEAKARRQLRTEKRQAMEKGRVKDVLIATRVDEAGEPETTTAEILETERRLRKVAQRGVVKLFNAVRAAQVKATEAEKGVKKAGVIGVGRREEKVNELSKKGFLELIASGGGGLKKGALEEA